MSASDSVISDHVSWYRALGPCVLLAGAAIGGSHIVWSSRAGALHGWHLLWALVLINVLKYPFFRYAQRYTAATGRSLIDGYAALGRGWLVAYALLSLPLSAVIVAGVGLLAGVLIAAGIHGLDADVGGTILPTGKHLTTGLLVFAVVLVGLGRYRLLEAFTKVVIAVLALTTIAAAVMAFGAERPPHPDFQPASMSLAFVVALMGWMPAPIDITVWSSLWLVGRCETQRRAVGMREAMTDFNVGYVITAALTLPFLAMGALMMHGSVYPVADKGVGFCLQLLGAYQASLGTWAMWLVLIAAGATMVSTTVTCVDGYGRSLAAAWARLRVGPGAALQRPVFIALMVVICAAAAGIYYASVGNLLTLLKWAAVISFLTSPLYGLLNTLVMTRDPAVPAAARPGVAMRVWSWLSLAVMTVLGLAFVAVA